MSNNKQFFHLPFRDDRLVATVCTLTLLLPLDCLVLAVVDFGFQLGPVTAPLVTRILLVVANFPLSGSDLFLVLERVVILLGFLASGICELSGIEDLFLEPLPVADWVVLTTDEGLDGGALDGVGVVGCHLTLFVAPPLVVFLAARFF